MREPLLRKRLGDYDARTHLEVNVTREWGGVGVSLTRDIEQGVLAVRLPFLKLYLVSEAWSYDPPKGIEEYRLSVDVHSWAVWVYPGRVPWMRGPKAPPYVLHIPHLEWRCETLERDKQDHGHHLYTYQWKYHPQVVQHVSAHVTSSERVDRLKFGPWRLPWRRTSRSLWVEFSEEMGDERGGWKGGALGAGFEVRPGQTWQEAYRQMQKERIFCRGK
ncbi:hypothetical protein DM785_02470 [Deinococcus actinosclerus]|nr:hypothetical protein DM785_02470 [Deinococcus actinosclerus]